MTKSTDIVTLGCRLNTLESEVMRQHMHNQGVTDAVIVNTCAVTAEAERQARQTIRKIRRERPDARIIVTGCAAQLNPERFADMDEVDRVVGNAEKLDGDLLFADDGPISVSDIQDVKETAAHLVEGLEGRTRAFVLIQQGCDNTCTFCIIPSARGPSRSVPLDQVIAQVQELTRTGHAEVVLTGVDIAAYGDDLSGPETLTDVIRAVIDAVPGLKRLRLSSLDPARLDDAFFALYAAEPRLMAHLHLSLQAADDMILKRMKRRHRVADVDALIARAKHLRPDTAIGADIIAGFPTETDEMADNTLRAVKHWGIAYLHVFPYSAREGTPAAKMPPVKGNVAKARAKALRDAGAENLAAYLKTFVGQELDVLVEKPGFGRTETFAPVAFTGGSAGCIVRARIMDSDQETLKAELL